MALEEGLGGESVDRVCAYLCDLIAHSIENTDGAEPPRVMGASPLAPEKWTAKAILIDELRGESEALERIAVGSETVELQWVVPISQKEAALILDQGSMRSTRMSRAWRIPSSIPRGRNRPLNRPRADTRCTP